MKYLLVLVLLLVGCTQTVAPSASPSVQPTPSMATPSAQPTCAPVGGTPYPCSADEFQKVQEQNRLTEEAIALYRRWSKESTRPYRAGGTNKPTPEMRATTAGEFRASALGVFQDIKAARARAVSGELKIVNIGPDLKAKPARGSVAITTCVDAHSLKFYRDGKKLRNGANFSEDVVARLVDGKLKLWSAYSEGTTSCAG